MINPVESGLDLFSAIVRDMFKTDYRYGIYKNIFSRGWQKLQLYENTKT